MLSWLTDGQDEAAIFTFDTELLEISPFTSGLKALPAAMRPSSRSARRSSAMRSPRRLNASGVAREGAERWSC